MGIKSSALLFAVLAVSIVYSQYLSVTVKILPTAVCRPLLSSAAEVEPGQTRSGCVNFSNGGDLSLRQRDDDSTATKEVDWLRFSDCRSRVGALFLTEKYTNRPTTMDFVINSHETLLLPARLVQVFNQSRKLIYIRNLCYTRLITSLSPTTINLFHRFHPSSINGSVTCAYAKQSFHTL
jgi:hypothetical protein